MNINGAVKAFKVIAKSLFNKLPTAKDPARFLSENAQQFEFNRCEIERPASDRSLVFVKV